MKDQTLTSKQTIPSESNSAKQTVASSVAARPATAKRPSAKPAAATQVEDAEAKRRKDRAALAAFYILFGSLLLALIYFIALMFLM